MKNRRFAWSLLALALAAGCGDSDDTDYSKLPEAPKQAAYVGPKVSLRHRWTPGAYEIATEMDMDQTVTPGGRPSQRQKMSQEIHVRLDVDARGEAGTKDARLSYGSVVQKMTVGGQVLGYDSNGPAAQNAPQLAAVLEPLMGADIRITLDAEDRVSEVRGLNEVWDKVARTNPQLAGMAGQMKNEMGDEMIRQLLNGSAEMLPQEPVGTGDTWPATIPLNVPFVGKVNVEYECRLDDVEETADGQVAHIAFRGHLKEEGATTASVGPGRVTIKDVDFKQVGSMQFDIDTGMVAGTTMKQTGRISMIAQGTEAKVTQDMTMHQTLRKR